MTSYVPSRATTDEIREMFGLSWVQWEAIARLGAAKSQVEIDIIVDSITERELAEIDQWVLLAEQRIRRQS